MFRTVRLTCETNSKLALYIGGLWTAVESRDPTLGHVIPSRSGGGVAAVTSLGDDVFVLHINGLQQVEVYDAVSCTLSRLITVHGLGDYTWGLAACAGCKCLYVSDYNNRCIHRTELTGSNAVMRWTMALRPRGLSVNRAYNIVVACDSANKLQEYTTDGHLVREICLQAGVTWPWHAVQLSSGDYVVSQYRSPGVVSVVAANGQVRRNYEPPQTSDVAPMKYLANLAVTMNDDVLVADQGNGRILSVSSQSSVQELALPVDGGIQQPIGLCLDESRGRLYVGELVEGVRLLVFNVVKL